MKRHPVTEELFRTEINRQDWRSTTQNYYVCYSSKERLHPYPQTHTKSHAYSDVYLYIRMFICINLITYFISLTSIVLFQSKTPGFKTEFCSLKKLYRGTQTFDSGL